MSVTNINVKCTQRDFCDSTFYSSYIAPIVELIIKERGRSSEGIVETSDSRPLELPEKSGKISLARLGFSL